MKYLSLLIIAIGLCLTSCNHNDGPALEVNIAINEQFVPGNVIFSLSDTEFKDKIKPWYNKKVVVNSAQELPADPLGFNESYYKIDFKNHTLLIYYDIHDYNVVSYSNRYYRNTVENTYNWTIMLGISGTIADGEEGARAIFSRYAVLVPKLSENAEVKIWNSLVDHNFDWGRNE